MESESRIEADYVQYGFSLTKHVCRTTRYDLHKTQAGVDENYKRNEQSAV